MHEPFCLFSKLNGLSDLCNTLYKQKLEANQFYMDIKMNTNFLKIVIANYFISVPKDPPNNMTFQKIPDEVTKFQLTFLPPSQPNGNIQVYQALVYQEDDPTAVQIRNLSIIQKTDTSVIAMLEGLKGGHTYNISVRIHSF